MNIFINIASYDHDMIIFQGRPLVLIINLYAHFHSDSARYPDSSFQSDSGLSQGGTESGLPVVYIPTVVSSLSDYSPQHSHSYIYVIFINAYKILCICQYAWQK